MKKNNNNIQIMIQRLMISNAFHISVRKISLQTGVGNNISRGGPGKWICFRAKKY